LSRIIRVYVAADSKDFMILGQRFRRFDTVPVCVTDGQTDRQTDAQTMAKKREACCYRE